MLYLGYVLLRYVLIYNLEISYDFHLTVLQLNVIQMFPVQFPVFYVTLGYFLRTPDNSNLFSISLEGSSHLESTKLAGGSYTILATAGKKNFRVYYNELEFHVSAHFIKNQNANLGFPQEFIRVIHHCTKASNFIL